MMQGEVKRNPPPPPPRNKGISASEGNLSLNLINDDNAFQQTQPSASTAGASVRSPPPVPIRRNTVSTGALEEAMISPRNRGQGNSPTTNEPTGVVSPQPAKTGKGPPPPVPSRNRSASVSMDTSNSALLSRSLENTSTTLQPAQSDGVVVGPRPASTNNPSPLSTSQTSSAGSPGGLRPPLPTGPRPQPRKRPGSKSERAPARPRSISNGSNNLASAISPAVGNINTSSSDSAVPGLTPAPAATKILAPDLHNIRLDDVQSNESSMKRLSGLFLRKKSESEVDVHKSPQDQGDLLSRWRIEEEKRRKMEAAEREKRARLEEEESLAELRKMREDEKKRKAAAAAAAGAAPAGGPSSPRGAGGGPSSPRGAGGGAGDNNTNNKAGESQQHSEETVSKAERAKKAIENMYTLARRPSVTVTTATPLGIMGEGGGASSPSKKVTISTPSQKDMAALLSSNPVSQSSSSSGPAKFKCKRWGIGHHSERGVLQVKKLKKVEKEDVTLVLDNRGITVYSTQEKELANYPFPEIENFGWSKKTFSFILVDKTSPFNVFEFKTSQGKDIYDKLVSQKASAGGGVKTPKRPPPPPPSQSASSPSLTPPAASAVSPLQRQRRERPDTQYFAGLPNIDSLSFNDNSNNHNHHNNNSHHHSNSHGNNTSNLLKRPPVSPRGEQQQQQQQQPGSKHRSEPYLPSEISKDGGDSHHRPFSTPELPVSPDAYLPPSPRSGATMSNLCMSVDSVTTLAPPKKRSMREEVVNELITTERIYNRHLNVIVDNWMNRLRTCGLLDQSDISMIFSNVEQIRNLNRELMTSLDGLVDLPIEQQNVGERFLSFVAFLKLYTQYCANESYGLQRLLEVKKNNPTLEELLELIKQEKQSEQLNLESFLIKPMQRVTKYPLLLKALMEHTPPEHPDYKNLTTCYDECHKVVVLVNEQKRQAENLQKLLEIQHSFLEDSEGEQLKLMDPTRKFIMEGQFKKIMKGESTIKNCMLFLFNDIMVLATKKGKGKYQTRSGKISISDILVWDDNQDGKNTTFSIVGTSTEKLTVFAASMEEKQRWVDEINNTLVNLPNVQLLKSLQNAGSVEKFSRQV